MPSITYLMVRSAEGASRTTHGGNANPVFRFGGNSFTRSKSGIHSRPAHRPEPVPGRPQAGPTGRYDNVFWTRSVRIAPFADEAHTAGFTRRSLFLSSDLAVEPSEVLGQYCVAPRLPRKT